MMKVIDDICNRLTGERTIIELNDKEDYDIFLLKMIRKCKPELSFDGWHYDKKRETMYRCDMDEFGEVEELYRIENSLLTYREINSSPAQCGGWIKRSTFYEGTWYNTSTISDLTYVLTYDRILYVADVTDTAAEIKVSFTQALPEHVYQDTVIKHKLITRGEFEEMLDDDCKNAIEIFNKIYYSNELTEEVLFAE